MSRRSVLLLADSCNPEWPSLPIVAYKYAKALSEYAEITVATHVRNRDNIEAASNLNANIDFIDTEWLAAPLHKLSRVLRAGDEVSWSTATIMKYPAYVAFELQAWRRYRDRILDGTFDIVHRITPMSPTMPSPIAKRCGVPFVLGPLNGNLDWPEAYQNEMKREGERARVLRTFYRALPYARSTQEEPNCILASFDHTIRDLNRASPEKIVPFPEIGYDPSIFHSKGRLPPFNHVGPYNFLFVGRLVPYKLAEAVVRAFAGSATLRQHSLKIIGDGPERGRLVGLASELGVDKIVHFEGRKTQNEVAHEMRKADAFVFPSIRELGAGVVIEAMACGAVTIVTKYGAPGALTASERGVAVQLGSLYEISTALRSAMEKCIAEPEPHRQLALKAELFAQSYYTWDAKARYTAEIYEAIFNQRPLTGFRAYE